MEMKGSVLVVVLRKFCDLKCVVYCNLALENFWHVIDDLGHLDESRGHKSWMQVA